MSSTVTYKGSTIASVSNTTKTLETAGKYMEDDVTITDVSQATPVLETVTKSYTPTETAQSETITAGAGYDGISEVDVSVGAISSSYVGSGITRRSSTDLSASGGTVTAPAGYYSSSASKAVATGSATAPASISGTSATVSTSGTSTLTLSKTVSVTPSVSAGYVSSGTAGNSSVSLSASVNIRSSSDLTASGDTVTAPAGYYGTAATKAVAAGTAGTPTATKGTVSNHSVSVTPSVTNTTGYITGSTKTGTAVTVTASELASGNKAITSNGTGIDVVGYSTVSVDVAGGGGAGEWYQDQDGYIVISDEESGPSIQVDPLSVTQNGTYTAQTGHAYSPVVVNVSGGGGAVEEKQINFIDYDGTILHSYTKTEINAMTQESELPANPSHTGLTAQGWNWTLAQIKAQLTAIPDGPVWVGQMYITTSGDTEIDVSFVDSARLSPILTIAVNGTITVDWGDNTTADTVTGTGLTTRKEVPHTYANTGNYIIVIHVVSGEFTFYGSSAYTILRKNNVGDENRVYANCIKNVRLGSNITSIGSSAFSYCYSLASVTIPSNITSILSSAFNYCLSLASVTIPSDVTSIGNNAFSYCYSLTSLTIPSGITSILGSTFYYCYSLASVTIPSNVTSIGNSAFNGCYALASLTIPSGITSIGSNMVQYCQSLSSFTIPSGITSIGGSAFYCCYSLASITIPSTVTSIGDSAFSTCYGVAEYHIQPTTVPTGGTTMFNRILSDCIIYVPYSADHSILEAYQTATNWSTYASYMQEEPQ